jgi:hypothetical protein
MDAYLLSLFYGGREVPVLPDLDDTCRTFFHTDSIAFTQFWVNRKEAHLFIPFAAVRLLPPF